MSNHEEHGFNSTRIFLILLAATAIEVFLSVVWGWIDRPAEYKYLYWAGLAAFAFWKGLLIYSYFMHMKFEGWIVKGLIVPTPILIIVVLAALTPDIATNHKLVAPIGYMQNPETGVTEQMNDDLYPKSHGDHEAGDTHGSGH